MKLSLKEILGYSIETYDQVAGKIKDFLFDDEHWVIRYVDADLGIDLSERRVLIPQTFLKETEWSTQNFRVSLSIQGLTSCPTLAKYLPISRVYEEELNRHYRITDYWITNNPATNIPDKIGHSNLPYHKVKVPPKSIKEEDVDTNLRSFREILGYDVLNSDGNIGSVDDLLIDSDDWSIISIIVKTSKSKQTSKKIIIASTWIGEASYLDKQIKILLGTKEVENALEYNPLEPINEKIEKRYYNYLGKPIK